MNLQEIINKTCNKQKHKLRTNNYGITWCVRCGLLSNKLSKTLQEQDKIIILSHNSTG